MKEEVVVLVCILVFLFTVLGSILLGTHLSNEDALKCYQINSIKSAIELKVLCGSMR